MELILEILVTVMQVIAVSYLLKAISGIRIKWVFWTALVPIWYLFQSFYPVLVIGYSWFWVRKERPLETTIRQFFYATTPVTIMTVFYVSLMTYFKMLLGLEFVEANIAWVALISYLLIFGIFNVMIAWLKIDYDLIRRYTSQVFLDKILVPINILTIAYWLLSLITLFVSGMIAGMIEAGLELPINMSEQLALHITEQLTVVFFFTYVVSMLRLSYTIRENQEQEAQVHYEQQLSSLSDYSQHVDGLYQEIRSFRHDYVTLLSSLSSAIEEKDIKGVEAIYSGLLAETGKTFYQEKYEIGNLTRLTEPAIKSVMSAKLREAQYKGIAVTVEIEKELAAPPMDLLDYLTLLSIFLDNAIEAAQVSEQPQINLACFEDSGTYHLIVENSTAEDRVSITKLFRKGYSSKGENRGLGLYKVKSLLDSYPRASLSTTSSGYRFKQTLEINS
ncbi:sensor histidine kinase [Streptococcus porci]|uniref:sensor histidine kinase n=1 Tax=Streptococcus porci TaxID=502567 RepID=UPI00040AB8B1|nr:GHKL domain-containing protein [Streptococcus porci]